jgi:single-strand DNA-binding protein
MNSLNSILIEGNLTKDPKLSETPKGTPVCNLSLASNRYYKQDGNPQNEVSFFDVEVWSKLADTCAEYLSKGRGVRVVGRLKQDRWQDKEGKPVSRVKIVAEHVEFRPEFKKKEDGSEEESEDDAEKSLLADSELKEVEEVAESV